MHLPTRFIIDESFLGLLYENGRFVRVLEPGRHEFPRRLLRPIERRVAMVDMRERSLTIKGQEILTADKVAIRVSLLVYFKVVDATAAMHNVASYEERIYEDVQLAARRFLATRDLDAILSDRNEISDAVRDDVKGAAETYGVQITRADVKDLVFPGNLREIMNQVLETERRAEAKLIDARKESEAVRIRSAAENEALVARLEAERTQQRFALEAERERAESTLELALKEAETTREHPELLQLKRLAVLRSMAESGGRFVVGLDGAGMNPFAGDDG